MTDIATARALEVVLARVPVPYSIARCLMASLELERARTRGPDPARALDRDGIVAGMMLALGELDVAEDFPKAALIWRARAASKILRTIIAEVTP